MDANSYIYYTPITNLSKGTDALTHSVFLNDSWRVTDRLSVNLGVRWDKNHAKDSNGVVRADDSAFSPRLAASFDVTGKGTLRVGASYAKYVGAIQDSLVDSASDGGSPSTFIWYYHGPGATPINVNPAPGATLVTRAQALQQVFNWFFAQGCPDLTKCRLPLGYANIPGLTTLIQGSLSVAVDDRVRRDGRRQRGVLVRLPGRPRAARGPRLLQQRDQRVDGHRPGRVREHVRHRVHQQLEHRGAQLHGPPHEPLVPERRLQRRESTGRGRTRSAT